MKLLIIIFLLYSVINLMSTESIKLMNLTGHTRYVTCLAIILNDGLLASGSDDKTIKIWNLKAGTQIKTLTNHKAKITSLLDLKDARLASTSEDNTLKIWNISNGNLIKSFKFSTIKNLVYLTDNLVACGWSDGISILNIKNNAIEFNNTLIKNINYLIALDNVSLAFSSPNSKSIFIWNYLHNTHNKILDNKDTSFDEDYYSTSLVRLPNGTLLSAHTDNVIRMWDISSSNMLKNIYSSGNVTLTCFVSLTNELLAISYENNIKIWDIVKNKTIKTLEGHSEDVESLVFLPNGFLASGSRDKTILIWNIQSVISGTKTNTTNDDHDDNDDTIKSFIPIIYYFLYFIAACFVYALIVAILSQFKGIIFF